MKNFRIAVLAAFILTMGMGIGISSVAAGGGKETKRSNAPSWFAEIPPEDAVWGIGIAKLENPSLAMEVAETRAQRSAARQIGALVQGMLTDYANESGLSSNPRSIVAIENIGRNIVNMELRGATINAREQMPDGTWYVRVTVKKTSALNQVNSIINNETANFAEFKAAQAIQQLNFEINKAQSVPSQFVVEE